MGSALQGLLVTMLDSPYGDVRLSRARFVRGHSAFSQVLPQRALTREKIRTGDPIRMLDSMARRQ